MGCAESRLVGICRESEGVHQIKISIPFLARKGPETRGFRPGSGVSPDTKYFRGRWEGKQTFALKGILVQSPRKGVRGRVEWGRFSNLLVCDCHPFKMGCAGQGRQSMGRAADKELD